MRHFFSLGVILAVTAGCGGDTGSGQSTGPSTNTGGANNAGASGAGGASGASGSGGTGANSGGSSGVQCTTTAECPQPGCYMCPGYVCVDGRCVGAPTSSGGATGDGGATGALRWYITCGPPVCAAPGTGGSSSGLPACSTTETEGSSCTTAGAECDTGASCVGPLKCASSDPTNGGACPKSRAKYKTDIEYLTPAERAKLADDVQSIPLVRYRYKEGPERQHLGFIIEDVEPSPSVDSPNDRVDLYGYTSMAIAALQEQRREIESLKAEVRELRTQLSSKQRKP